jgi:Transglycosylase SLT domain/D-alanyl-D-alanine carboxypeptidase
MAALGFALVAVVVLGGVAQGLGAEGRDQRAADLAALGGAQAMREDYARLFEPATIERRPNPQHLERGEYLAHARERALASARLNGARAVAVSFPDGASFAPVRIRVAVDDPAVVDLGGRRHVAAVLASAEAELSVGAAAAVPAAPGDYRGPLAYRQGKPMRPDVAIAFDRLAAAAAAAGHQLIVVSGFRSSAEQALLFARHPDPKWVAPPGHSLHRLGTELDLGPDSAYAWLAAHAGAYRFIRRYQWEPWHFGYSLGPGSTSVGFGNAGDGRGAIPSFVPPRFAPLIAQASQRWNVSAALLAAQLYAESGFNPFSVSPAGAQGIAQFTPDTAAVYGLSNPFDPAQSINAQAHLMRDLLRQFGAVPLALAAYNAGPGAVAHCGCVPPYPETQAYVARILGLLGGAGAASGAEWTIRLVR